MKLIAYGEISRDCTCRYEVLLDKEYTVSEFVSVVLEERPNEWGNIKVTENGDYWSGKIVCDYSYGNIKYINSLFSDKTIKKVTAVGGWSNMDYILYI